MKHLYLVRHAETEFGDAITRDHDRKLTNNGLKQASDLSDFIKSNQYIPDLILHSSAIRIKQTLNGIIDPLDNHKIDIIEDEKLYLPGTGYLLQTIEMIDSKYETAMIISHNPALGDILNTISKGRVYDYKQGSISIIRIDCDNWFDVTIKELSLLRIFEA